MLVLGIIVFFLVCLAYAISEERYMKKVLEENKGAYIIIE